MSGDRSTVQKKPTFVSVTSKKWHVVFTDNGTNKYPAEFDSKYVCTKCTIQQNQGKPFPALEEHIHAFFNSPEGSEISELEKKVHKFAKKIQSECNNDNCTFQTITLHLEDPTNFRYVIERAGRNDAVKVSIYDGSNSFLKDMICKDGSRQRLASAIVVAIAKGSDDVKLQNVDESDNVYIFKSARSASSGWLSPRRRRWPSYVSSTSESSSDDGAWGESSRPFSFSGRRTVYNPETGRRVRENSATGVRILSSREDCPLGTVREVYRPRRGEPPSVITDRPCVPYARGMTGKCPSGLTKSSKTGTCVLLETERKNRM